MIIANRLTFKTPLELQDAKAEEDQTGNGQKGKKYFGKEIFQWKKHEKLSDSVIYVSIDKNAFNSSIKSSKEE